MCLNTTVKQGGDREVGEHLTQGWIHLRVKPGLCHVAWMGVDPRSAQEGRCLLWIRCGARAGNAVRLGPGLGLVGCGETLADQLWRSRHFHTCVPCVLNQVPSPPTHLAPSPWSDPALLCWGLHREQCRLVQLAGPREILPFLSHHPAGALHKLWTTNNHCAGFACHAACPASKIPWDVLGWNLDPKIPHSPLPAHRVCTE